MKSKDINSKNDAEADVSPEAKSPSFSDRAKASFEIMLAGAAAEFVEGETAYVHKLDPSLPFPSSWFVGNSIIAAKLIVDQLPLKHRRGYSMKNGPSGNVVAEIAEISRAAHKAVRAWELSGGDVGPVKLVRVAERPSSEKSWEGEGLFAAVLDGKPVEFSKDAVITEPLSEYFPRPTEWELFDTLEECRAVAAALPVEHVRLLHLQAVGQNITYAEITQFSCLAIALIHEWSRAGRPQNRPEVVAYFTEFAGRLVAEEDEEE